MFPLTLCLDFTVNNFENRPIPFGYCELSYIKRLGQVAPLIAFIGALIATLPIRLSKRAKENKRQGPRLIKELEIELKQSERNGSAKKAESARRKLKLWRSWLKNSKDLPSLESSLMRIGIAIAFVATVLRRACSRTQATPEASRASSLPQVCGEARRRCVPPRPASARPATGETRARSCGTGTARRAGAVAGHSPGTPCAARSGCHWPAARTGR